MFAFVITVLAGAAMGSILGAVGYEVTDFMFWFLLLPTLITINWTMRILSS